MPTFELTDILATDAKPFGGSVQAMCATGVTGMIVADCNFQNDGYKCQMTIEQLILLFHQ